MSNDERFKNPEPGRAAPVRDWRTLFQTPSAASLAEGPSSKGPAEPGSMSDVVTQSVDIGYRVMDEYLQQGQKAAQRWNSRNFDPEASVGDMQDLSIRMTQYASDFMATWFQFLDIASRSGVFQGFAGASPGMTNPAAGPGPGPATAPGPVSGAAAPSSTAAPAAEPVASVNAVAVLLSSAQPAEVTVDLRSSIEGEVVVHDLRATDVEKPRIQEVTLERANEDRGPRLRIRIPDDQPPGMYSGLMIEQESNLPVGSVTVRIGTLD